MAVAVTWQIAKTAVGWKLLQKNPSIIKDIVIMNQKTHLPGVGTSVVNLLHKSALALPIHHILYATFLFFC